MTREPPIPPEATALGAYASRWRERTGKVYQTWSEVVAMLLDLGWTPPPAVGVLAPEALRESEKPLAAARDVR